MTRSLKLVILSCFVFVTNFHQAQSPNEILTKTVGQEAFENADLGIYIKNLSTNKVLISHFENKPLVPASILKIRTVRRSLELFGADHRFKTSAWLVGEIENGVFYGDIVLKGFGDPTFDDNIAEAAGMKQVAESILSFLRQHRVSCIYGGIVSDASYFELPGVPAGYIEEDIANYYGAGVFGLNVQNNAYNVFFDRSTKEKPVIKKFDSLAVSFVSSKVQAKGYSDQAYIYRHPDGNGVIVRGSIPVGKGEFRIKGSIKNPPLYAARKLHNMLQDEQVEIQSLPNAIWQPYRVHGKLIWNRTFESPKLKDILKPILHKSNNMYAEALHRHVQKVKKQSLEPSTRLDDGSGLSPTNRISAKNLMSDLQKLMESGEYSTFLQNMPRNGVDGTVKSILKNRKNKLLIKSGSIGGVRSYMGLRKSESGDWIGFVCIANQLTCSGSESRKAWEVILDWLAMQ